MTAPEALELGGLSAAQMVPIVRTLERVCAEHDRMASEVARDRLSASQYREILRFLKGDGARALAWDASSEKWTIISVAAGVYGQLDKSPHKAMLKFKKTQEG